MKQASIDVSKRVPALLAGQTMIGRFRSTVKRVSAHKNSINLSSLPEIDLAQAKIELKQKKNIIVVLVALNMALVGATAHRDHSVATHDQSRVLAATMVRQAEAAKTVTIEPVEAPVAQVATVESEKVLPTPTPTPVPQVSGVSVSRVIGPEKQDLMRAAGIPQSVWACVDHLVSRESGWRVNAQNPSSGAYGLPQALPGGKMVSAGADWATNPVTQLRWMSGYVDARYGGFCQAKNYQMANGWY